MLNVLPVVFNLTYKGVKKQQLDIDYYSIIKCQVSGRKTFVSAPEESREFINHNFLHYLVTSCINRESE